MRAISAHTTLISRTPTGYRARSWNCGPNGFTIPPDLGSRYERPRMADKHPYALLPCGARMGLAELPVAWFLDDAPLVDLRGERDTSPREGVQVWIDTLDRAGEARTRFARTLYPHVSGHRSRLEAQERLLGAHPRSAGAPPRLGGVRHARRGGGVRTHRGGAGGAGAAGAVGGGGGATRWAGMADAHP